MVTHTFNPSTQEERQLDLYEFKARLFYIASSWPARVTNIKKNNTQPDRETMWPAKCLISYLI